MYHPNASTKVNKWHCPTGQKPRPTNRKPFTSSAIIRKFYQLIQSRHHFLIFQKVEQTGQLPPAFQRQVDDLVEWIRPPCPTEELNQAVRDTTKVWASKICEELKSHYQTIYQETKEELSGKYSIQEIDNYRKEALRRARAQFNDRLKEGTVLEFMALDFRPVDSDTVSVSAKGRQLEKTILTLEWSENHKPSAIVQQCSDTTQPQTKDSISKKGGGEGKLPSMKPVKQNMSCKVATLPLINFNNYRGLLLSLVLLWFALILLCA